jgi:regulatory protein
MKPTTHPGGRITALEPQENRPERFSLFLDGEFVCGVSQAVVWDHGLYVGKELAEAEMRGLFQANELQRAREIAYLLLSYRARSSAEIEQKLIQKGFDPLLVKEVTGGLQSSGLLDDRAFAESWVRQRSQSRPRGKALLRRELRQKGITRDQAESALQAITPEEETENARSLARKRWEWENQTDPAVRRRRIIGLLQRRGYNWETIREALASLDELNQGDKSWEESPWES